MQSMLVYFQHILIQTTINCYDILSNKSNRILNLLLLDKSCITYTNRAYIVPEEITKQNVFAHHVYNSFLCDNGMYVNSPT